MRRSAAAYLSDILEACEAIDDVLSGVDLSTYRNTRAIRSAVEREFIIGEAVNALGRVAPDMLKHISHARVVIDAAGVYVGSRLTSRTLPRSRSHCHIVHPGDS